MIRRNLAVASIALLVSCAIQILIGSYSSAINPADFNPGRIIDDEVFYNKDGMGSAADIQAFLNAHTPSCDTWGTRPSGYGNLTNAQYAQQIKGWPGPPYVCLNNYHENPDTGATSFENGGGAFSGGLSAAQIIYNASQQYGINPKVLLVMLRKESLNLFGDSWPLKMQYKYAMGYACPDSGPGYSAACVDSKSGFYKQMTLAAWQLRYYYDHMGEYNYAPGRWNTIQYSPRPECGTKDVFIQNHATASLYIYTPYVPNTAALNAYPGEADCGAYGNRNFWFMWQEWFGSVYAGVHISSPLRISSKYGNDVFANTPTTVSFDVTNDSSNPVDIGGMAIAVRDSSGGNHDFSLKSMIIPAHSTRTYVDTQTFTKEDNYTFTFANYSGGVWKSDYPTMLNSAELRTRTVAFWNVPSLTQGVVVTNGPFQTGKIHTITYAVRNNSASTRTLGLFGLAVRGPSGENLDPVAPAAVTLGAGQTQVLSYSFKPQVEGTYQFMVAAKLSNWVSDYPISSGSSVSATLTSLSAPRVVLGSSLTTPSLDPRVGQNIPLSFAVRNNSEDSVDLGKLGLWGRDPQNRNVDPGVIATILGPGEQRIITLGIRPSVTGNYTFGLLGTRDGVVWDNGPTAGAGLTRNLTLSVNSGIVISSSVKLDSLSTNGYVGQKVNLTFKAKNYGDAAVDLGKIGLWGRDPQNRNVDPGIVTTVLNPGEERTMSFPVLFSSVGSYKFGILQTSDNGRTWGDGPISENSSQKQVSVGVTSGAIITQGPQTSVDNQNIHVTESISVVMKVKNQTSNVLDLGKLGLWGRDPQNRNVDPGIVTTVLNPGEERTMSFPVKLLVQGQYRFGILGTIDNGNTWSNGPNVATGQINTLNFGAKQSVTLISSASASLAQPSMGQCQNISYVIKNFDTKSVDLGKLGLWGRDPQNRNVDPGIVATVLTPGEERTMSFPICHSMAGTYSYGILQTMNNGVSWTDGPQKESDSILNKIQVSVK